MEVLYLLIPFSVLLVLGLLAVFAWALHGGQFDDLERQGERILQADGPALDVRQHAEAAAAEESPHRP